jgi:hypothetical protein
MNLDEGEIDHLDYKVARGEAAMAKRAALIARLRAALTFISPDDITPMGRRVLDRILDEEEATG